LRIGIGLSGPLAPATLHERERRDADFHDLADAIRHVARHLHLPDIELEPANEPPYQPGISARVRAGARVIGYAGAIHPSVARAFDLADRPVLAAELDLETMIEAAQRTFEAEKPPRFPSIEFDISAAVAKDVPAAELCRAAREAAG